MCIRDRIIQIRTDAVTLKYWPLPGFMLRLIGYPDASYRNNSDKSSQRGLAVFVATERTKNQTDAWGSLVEYESTKIKRTVLSTTVSELYGLMKCYGTCLFLKGLWMDMTGQILPIHIRTDANNCLLYTSPSPRDLSTSRMPSSA